MSSQSLLLRTLGLFSTAIVGMITLALMAGMAYDQRVRSTMAGVGPGMVGAFGAFFGLLSAPCAVAATD